MNQFQKDRREDPAGGTASFFQVLLREFSALVRLNLLFLLFCIPVVTIPAAWCAMTRVTAAMVQNRPYLLWSDFRAAFQGNFRRATVSGLIVWTGMALSGAGTVLYSSLTGESVVYLLLTIGAGLSFILFCSVHFTLFPMLALTDLPLVIVFKNAIYLTLLDGFRHLQAFVAACVVLWLGTMFFPANIAFLLFIGPALVNLITTFGAWGGIRQHVLTE